MICGAEILSALNSQVGPSCIVGTVARGNVPHGAQEPEPSIKVLRLWARSFRAPESGIDVPHQSETDSSSKYHTMTCFSFLQNQRLDTLSNFGSSPSLGVAIPLLCFFCG